MDGAKELKQLSGKTGWFNFPVSLSLLIRLAVHVLNAFIAVGPSFLPPQYRWLAQVAPFAVSGLTELTHARHVRAAKRADHAAKFDAAMHATGEKHKELFRRLGKRK